MTGKVYLVGAGPGDPKLITLRAVELIKSADVVLYDRLVSKKILAMIPKNAESIYVGRAVGDDITHQDNTNELMVKYAQLKKSVVRLKGGDPIIFGRGGEEAEFLKSFNIKYEIIPGITSGIGSATYAGIPLTHRDFNSTVTFIAGRGSAGELPERHNWEAIAKGSPVIVMYMATKYIHEIVGRLLNYGRKPDEPVAVIAKASLPEQIVLETRLCECVEEIKKNKIEPPALIVVGEVVSLRSYMKWMD